MSRKEYTENYSRRHSIFLSNLNFFFFWNEYFFKSFKTYENKVISVKPAKLL